MPRRYRLGKRSAQVEATHQRILDAASEAYQALGVSGTSVAEVARRADVASGTVLNHFGSAGGLASAVVERIVASIQLPDPAAFATNEPIGTRIRRLTIELFAFYDRSESWWRVYSRESGGVPAWAEAEANFYAGFDRLIRPALGAAAEDPAVMAVTSLLLGGDAYGGLRSRGVGSTEAAEIVADLLGPWLERRQATSPESSRLRVGLHR